MPILSRLFGNGVSQAAGVGIGTPTAAVLQPYVQDLINASWNNHQSFPLDVFALAQGVAQGEINREWARDEATLSGINQGRFDRLVDVFDTGPGVAQAYNLLHRGLIDEAGFRDAVKKEGIEDKWLDDLFAARNVLLSPDQIANAVQQGFLPNEGLLPDEATGGTPYNITAQTVDIPPIEEAEKSGVTSPRLKVLTQLSGNPPGPMELLDMWNRHIITEASVDAGIREGRTKTKWIPALKELRHFLLSPAEAAGLRLRGWISAAESYRLGALRGASQETMDYLFLNRGRPAAPGQMATAAARGIDGPDGRPMDKAQFLKGIRESDIRPEWGDLLWDTRFLYPPLFQLTRLVQGGAIDAETAADWARKDRYPPEVVDALHAYWTKPQADSGGSTQARLATTQARAALHKRFLVDRIDGGPVLAGLELLGSDPSEAGHILEMWTLEKGWLVKPLTPSQIKKLYTNGAATIDEAIESLEDLHMTEQDARDYLTS